MSNDNPRNIHFLGIGGSGASAVAVIAKKFGYSVSGCNLEFDTPYLKKVVDHKIKIFEGHGREHLENVDILATTPAIFFSEEDIDELKYARKEKKVISWQKFAGDYLMKDKKVIAVAGTHGKSTTTALAGLLLTEAKLDPTAQIGAKVNEWDANFRVGDSEYYIVEADEFFNNFHNYNPEIIILNNIEFDHPDFFKDKKEMLSSYKKFLGQIIGERILIVNQDSPEVVSLLKSLSKTFIKKTKIIGYTTKTKSNFKFDDIYKANKIRITKNNTNFIVNSSSKRNKEEFKLSLPGKFNISNALGIIALAGQLNIELDTIQKVLKDFKGLERRLEKIGEKDGVLIYDDYAHHPTAIELTLTALKQKHPKTKITVVIEPHSFSRTKALLDNYKNVFADADSVFVGPIFQARDKKDFGVNGMDIVEASGHKNIRNIPDLNELFRELQKSMHGKKVIIFMGAGDSYKWARNFLLFIK